MLVPVPVKEAPPGYRIKVHEPAGNPLNTTLPVDTVQEGCVTSPTKGAEGVTGCVLITIPEDAIEVHP